MAPTDRYNPRGVKGDMLNFILGVLEKYKNEPGVDFNVLYNFMPWLAWGAQYDNASKLGVMPVGIKGNALPTFDEETGEYVQGSYPQHMEWGSGFH